MLYFDLKKCFRINISVAETDTHKLRLFDDAGLGIYCLELAGHLCERNLDQLAVLVTDHEAEFLLEDQLARLRADPGREYAVVGIRSAAALCVSGNSDAESG